MAWPDRFGVCASNIFTNHVRPYYSYYEDIVVSWDVIYPQEQYMAIPIDGESSKQYLPGQETILFWDYSELNVGYPSFTITWAAMNGNDANKIIAEYDWAAQNSQSRVWITVPRIETGGWMYTSAVMEEPIIQQWAGDTALNMTLNFGRLGFHLNAPTNDHNTQHLSTSEGGNADKSAYVITQDYFGYFLFNNEDYRVSDWNY